MNLTVNSLIGTSHVNRQIVFAKRRSGSTHNQIGAFKQRLKEFVQTDVLPRRNELFALGQVIPKYENGQYSVIVSFHGPLELTDDQWREVLIRLSRMSNLTHQPDKDVDSPKMKARHYNMRLDGMDTLLIVQSHYYPSPRD